MIKYLDGKFIILEGRIDHHDEGEWDQGSLSLILEELRKVRNQGQSMVIKHFRWNIHTNKSFFWIHFPMKLQHFLHIFAVYNQGFLFIILRNCETTANINYASINCAEECSHYKCLSFGFPQEVVQNVWSDIGVDITVQLLYCKSEIQVGEICYLLLGLHFQWG